MKTIRREFEKPDCEPVVVTYPADKSQWRERKDAAAEIAELIRDGWRERVTAKQTEMFPTVPPSPVQAIQEDVIEFVLANLTNPVDWSAVFTMLGEHVPNITVRRKWLAIVQQRYREQQDEADRLARIEAKAAEIRASQAHQSLSEQARRDQDEAMARALAAQETATLKPKDTRRRIRFGASE